MVDEIVALWTNMILNECSVTCLKFWFQHVCKLNDRTKRWLWSCANLTKNEKSDRSFRSRDMSIHKDEFFYRLLIRRQDLPDAKTRLVPFCMYKKLLSHYQRWFGQNSDLCLSNRYVSRICQFDYHDLANIEKSGRSFANIHNDDGSAIIKHDDNWNASR